jgi:3'-phosphoadenosine 5'-phosphosulfate sulfotransferase (PAPS reductase)/FAD synthetase
MNQRTSQHKYVSWFSCGAASATATKLALKANPNVDICYQDTGAEHPDNKRFLADCEEWFGKKITVIKSDKFEDTWDVWEKRQYIAGIAGAPCTSELKRIPAESYLWDNYPVGTLEVFGYTVEEKHRVQRWQANNQERNIWPILIEKGFTKADCLGFIDRAGIELPAMYKLGYKNNNCIGCPKGQAGYWNKIRVDFPEVFERMAKLERKLDAAICKTYAGDGKRKRVFLDELSPDMGRIDDEPSISCGLFCMAEEDE